MDYVNWVYIGYDRREDVVCKTAMYSLWKHLPKRTTHTTFLVQDYLRAENYYVRPIDDKASTDFSLTRFLAPWLNEFNGWVIFVDGDFIFTQDINCIFDDLPENKDDYAVFVVKHNYTPKTQDKMGGQAQHMYPRKNWSSFMLFNCEHPSTQNLTSDYVNSASPADLHQFKWCADEEIGELPITYNFLVGEYDYDDSQELPVCLHYTLGAPGVFPDSPSTNLDWVYNQEKREFLNKIRIPQNRV